MAQTYTRQSSFIDGDTITAALFNDEYNQLVNAFAYSSTSATNTGHRHDGTAGQGGNIFKIGDLDFLNKVEIDSTNNRVGFYVEVSSAAVEQLRIQDGALVPVTDNDIDLGTSSLEFKDAFFDGTITTDALVADTADINGGTVDGATIGANSASTGAFTSVTTTGNVDVGGNLTVTGTTTFNGGTLTLGDSASDNVVFGADVDSSIIPDDDDSYDLGSSSQQWRNIFIDGTAEIDTLALDGTTVTSTAAELNILDGVTSTAAELNLLDGVTSTTAELNILDGVTSSTAELNILDGVTSTTAELNILDGVTSTAAELNILDGVTSTAAELNILDGVTATTTELNYVDVTTAGTVEASKAVVADSNADVLFSDNDKLKFGTGSDLQLYHDGSNSIIFNNTGRLDLRASNLAFKNTTNNETYATFTENSAVELYHDNAAKLATTSTGVSISDNITLGSDSVASSINILGDVFTLDVDSNGNTGGTPSMRFNISGSEKARINSSGLDVTGTVTATALNISQGTPLITLTDTSSSATTTITLDGVNTTINSNGTDGDIIFKGSDGGSEITALTLDMSAGGTAQFAHDIEMVDNGLLRMGAGGDLILTSDGTNGTIFTNNGALILDADSDIHLDANGADILLKDGGTTFGELTNSSTDFVIKSHTSDKDIIFKGNDGGSEITALTLDMSAGGKAVFSSNIDFGDGHFIGNDSDDNLYIASSASESIRLDSPDEIILDADGGNITLTDGGTAIGQFQLNDTNHLKLGSKVSDADIRFFGNDGGSTIVSLILDMSDAGTAIFNHDIKLADNGIARFGAGEDLLIFHDGSNNYIISNTQDQDLLIQGNDGGSTITALSFDMSQAGNASFNADVTVGGNLTVQGTTTTLNTATLDVEDKNITLNKGSGDTSGSADGAGITIQDAVDASNDATINWNATNDNFVFSHEIAVPSLDISGNVDIDGALETDALSINGTAVTATAAEINILDGLTASTAELNSAVGGTFSGVVIKSGITNFTNSVLISTDGSTGTLSSASHNTGLGDQVFDDLTSGTSNTAMGSGALDANTTGSSNTAIGRDSLGSNTTADANTAFGYGSLRDNTTGSANVGLGYLSLEENTTGGNNTAVGFQALEENTTASNNTAVGYFSLRKNTTGSALVAIGTNALDANTTGDNNVGVGMGALGANTTASNNTAVGRNALELNTTASSNTAIGSNSLASNTTGTNNTALGSNSLDANTTADGNTAVGKDSLGANTTGHSNTAIGKDSLKLNVDGNRNTGLGFGALNVANSPDDNTMVGYFAGVSITTGNSNTAVGSFALQATTTGDRNVAIGHGAADAGDVASRNSVLGYNALGADTKGSRNVAMGYGAVQTQNFTTATDAYNVGVGYNALGANTTGTNNTALGGLALNTNSTASNNTAVGYNSLYANTTGDTNTAVGKDAMLSNTTGTNNTALGTRTLDANTTGSNNVAVGDMALGANTTADFNTAVGTSSMQSTTTGTNSTAIGYASLYANTTGGSNTAVGNSALESNTTANNNVAVGTSALTTNTTGEGNTSVGKDSLKDNSTGSNNTAVGENALANNTTASENTAVGQNALLTSTTASGNVAMGHDAMRLTTTGGTSVGIGIDALRANTTGYSNVAIGHESLDANTTGAFNVSLGKGALTAQTTANFNVAVGATAGSSVTTGTNNTLVGVNAGDTIQSGSNNVAIGSEADIPHDTANAIIIGTGITATTNNEFSFGKASNVVSNIFTSNASFSRSSDLHKKTNIADTDIGLSFINELKPVTFNWRPNSEFPKHYKDYSETENSMDTEVNLYGMIAQDVEKALQKVGHENFGGWSKEEDGSQRLSQEMFIYPLINAVKELSAKVDELENKLN